MCQELVFVFHCRSTWWSPLLSGPLFSYRDTTKLLVCSHLYLSLFFQQWKNNPLNLVFWHPMVALRWKSVLEMALLELRNLIFLTGLYVDPHCHEISILQHHSFFCHHNLIYCYLIDAFRHYSFSCHHSLTYCYLIDPFSNFYCGKKLHYLLVPQTGFMNFKTILTFKNLYDIWDPHDFHTYNLLHPLDSIWLSPHWRA